MVAPIAGAVSVFLTGLVTHLLVILVVGQGHSGFGATFRVVAYSARSKVRTELAYRGAVWSSRPCVRELLDRTASPWCRERGSEDDAGVRVVKANMGNLISLIRGEGGR